MSASSNRFRDLTLYVIRHGECEHNVAGRAAAQNDSPLTANGREHARANGRLLKDMVFDLSTVDFFASSLHRTCTTMELLREAASLPPTGYIADRRLMEIDFGDHTWIRWNDISEEDCAAYKSDPWNLARPGGETQAQVYARTGEFLKTVTRDSVIVTHQMPARLIRAHYLNLTPGEAVRYEQPHGGILRLSGGGEAMFGE
ncbi:MAG TPA: histidine phosphatase family protein [Rhizomicrobium sp.]